MNYFILILVSSIALASEYKIPDGYRLPNPVEIKKRSEDMPKELSIDGDFDGDGKKDHVKFLISLNKLGVFVWWKNRPNSTPELVFEDNATAFYLMAMQVQKKGKIKTACGKGYFDCRKDEPEVLDLKTDAIDYYKPESASSFLVYDKKTKKFNRIWISD